MAAVQVPQIPFQGVNYLSRNSQSSQLHTPLYLDRITTNQDAYNSFLRDQSAWLVKPKWGSSGLHRDPTSKRPWTIEGSKNRNEPLSHLDKNHLHFGGGALSFGRVIPVEAQYNVTGMNRSNVRSTDELIPDANKINLGSSQIMLPFPAEHPYSSHTSKLAMFHKYDSPDDTRSGRVALTRALTLPCTAASANGNTIVVEKIKGSPYRREITRVVNDSERKPLQWYGQTFNQLLKSPEAKKQAIYPTPPTSIKPDFWDRPPSLTVSRKTANELQNMQALNGKSEYSRKYTGHWTTGAKKLDNYDEKPLSQNQLYPACTLGRKGEVSAVHGSNDQSTLNSENKSSYTSTYNADYSAESYQEIPTSIFRKIVPNKLNVSRNFELSNKNVKFDDKVIISNGHETSYGLVNDLKENTNLRQLPQSPRQRPGTPHCPVKKLTRPATSPCCQRDSVARLPRPGAHKDKVNPNLNEIVLRPSTAWGDRKLCDQLLQIQDNFTKTDSNRTFHHDFPEGAPDIRKTPDTRITTNERRHFIPEVGCHSFYFHG